ncbi:hypothetical protein PF005_g10416 [Phytophthora fragariae]|uniref:Uncharacterized protein n=3 Tax=Phytophthora TaxID=4783 RepID=A0A6A3Y647_9STRA|nr:hypothetical protein PF003_g6809 [Phytophthora fragariae]KAE8943135.1 hypothetical protein PF009_g7128 [Phytophthora fragariae]KAE9006291.1 hypothetical protein PF011_g11650 [Phytophthora fragariae]KAE9090062.1 hypothetical protein PF007_g19377 [Phytophthora fragariae]KAE9108793.1 hypothetical protein PF010_g11776 [Phytophthora fragariae]
MSLLSEELQAPHELLSASTAVTASSSSCSWQRPALPEASQTPPDVMLHVGGCVFALHEDVLRLRWPWLHLQLQRLRGAPVDNLPLTTNSSQFKLQLLSSDIPHTETCPLQTITLTKPLLYTKCLSRDHRRPRVEDEDSSSDEGRELLNIIDTKKRARKRKRTEMMLQNENEAENGCLVSRRARQLFEEKEDVVMAEKVESVLHVELVGAAAIAVVPVIEYVYTFKVRLLHESSVMKTLRLAQWVGMGDRIIYSCLRIAVRQATLDTWMELLVASASLGREDMRRKLCDRLVDFLYELQPVQYQDAMDKLQTVWIQVIEDKDMLVRVVVALINNVRLVGFWRNLLDALVKWLKRWFKAPQLPSLRQMHEHFVTDWEPYVELSRVECFTNTSRSNSAALHVTLFEFGEFVLQACINASGSTPLLWRIIRRTSPNFFSEDPEVVESGALDGDPEFWIRGQLIVKYQPIDRGGGIVTEQTRIEYQHCRHQYCMWKALVSPQSLPAWVRATTLKDEGWVNYEDPAHNYYRRTVCTVSGKLFLWGDPICSLYNQLLQTTLFYSAPNNVGPEVADILTVSEMQRLPIDTLVLVLRSDRLRIPEGERTLLRCLNKMVFGLDVYHLRADDQLSRPYNGRLENVTRLYRCARWCFVPLDDIMQTLRWAPRTLKLYEIIVESLRDPNRTCKRRRPFGWRKCRDAYMTNETNLSEFEIEAGDLNLAPSGAAALTERSPTARR